MTPDQGPTLKSGFTTGTAAAAATKGALLLLLKDQAPDHVFVRFLTGEKIRIQMHTCTRVGARTARCSVIKDAGDDPDVTHKAEIGAMVTYPVNSASESVVITGGKGVGRVTKPGLGIPVGEPSITEGPRKMIVQSVEEVMQQYGIRGDVITELFVPQGEILAQKTLNARLGIVGGISILGTTGVVRPMSHEAYIATINAALSVARAAGLEQVILATGRRSERYSQMRWNKLSEEAFVQIGDYFQMSLAKVAEKGLKKASLTVFFGKAVKMAQGVPHTHAAKTRLSLQKLSEWAFESTGNRRLAGRIAAANTARHALDYILPEFPEVIAQVGNRIVTSARRFAGAGVQIQSVIYNFEGNVIFDSEKTG